MKKFLLMLAVVVMTIMTSCGGADYKAIHDKIEAGTELSQEDYSEMIDYVMDGMKAQMTAMKSLSDNSSEEEMNEAFNVTKNKYPYSQDFLMCLTSAVNEDKLDADNQEKWKKANEEMEKEFSL